MLFHVRTWRDANMFQKENQVPDYEYCVVADSMEEAVRQVEHVLASAPDAESAYIESVTRTAPRCGAQLILVGPYASV